MPNLKNNLNKLLLVLLCVFSAPAYAVPTVTVMAENAMSIALSEIAREYSRTRAVVVNTAFNAQSAQQTQINDGGAVDVLITQKITWLDDLKSRGLTDISSRAEIAKDQLALVGPVNTTMRAKLSASFPTASLIEQMGSEPVFVVGNPQSQMVGVYGKEALRKYGVLGDLEPYTLYIKEPREMLNMVTQQNAYGIFLYSGVIGKPEIKVIDIFPKSSHKPISYYAVVIAGDNMDEARTFLDYLKSTSAKIIFARNGFLAE